VGAVLNGEGTWISGSILKNCEVGYSGSLGPAIEVASPQIAPLIDSCNIHDSASMGLLITSASSYRVSNNELSNNSSYGLYVSIANSGSVEDVFITGNNIHHNQSAGLSISGNITDQNGWTITVESNSISDNTQAGVDYYTRDIQLTIRDNTISRNKHGIRGERSVYYAETLITENVISDNDAGNWNGGGIFIGENLGNSQLTISSNTIENNRATKGAGMYVDVHQMHPLTIRNNIIRNNTAANTNDSTSPEGGGVVIQYGVYDSGTSAHITGNLIEGNVADRYGAGSFSLVNGGPSYYSGTVTMSVPQGDNTFKDNTIRGNATTGANGSKISYCTSQESCSWQTSFTSSILLGGNAVTSGNNVHDNSAEYVVEVRNGSISGDLDVTNNWWGTTSESEIGSGIYDFFEDGGLALTLISPVLTSPNSSAP
jgi:hypothetical protein